MRFSIFLIMSGFIFADSSADYGTAGSTDPIVPSADSVAFGATDTARMITIKIGAGSFPALLENNETARAFRALLPLTLQMNELNANEKYADLPQALPVNASNPGNIRAGDLMMYGSRTLVLFYKSFSTTYGYTKVGQLTDIKNLTNVLGAGNVRVSFKAGE